jgi:thioredoxin reductase
MEVVRMTDRLNAAYDVLVIGGGAAGLSGALMLARSRRSVAVIDAGAPRNAPAEGVHGLLGRDGTPPGELLARGRAEVRSYGGSVVDGEVAAVRRRPEGFEVELADGRASRARRLLVTIGLVDELPDVKGLRERWGRDVVHCPYCHGWEARDKAIGVLGTGPLSIHQALLFRQLSEDVVLFTGTMPTLTDEQSEQLAARGIRVVEGEVAAVETADDRIAGVRMAAAGEFVPREVVAVGPTARLRAGFLAELGLLPKQHPSGMGEYLAADPAGRAEVPGVWLAGNVADLSAQVGAAAAAGATAGAQINFDLVDEETAAAVRARREARRPSGPENAPS